MKTNSFDPAVTHGPVCYLFYAAISRHTGGLEFFFFKETFPAFYTMDWEHHCMLVFIWLLANNKNETLIFFPFLFTCF